MDNEIFALLNESFWLLLTGMAVVFVFLTLLIGAIKLIERFCQVYPGEEAVPPKPVSSAPAEVSAKGVSPQVVAAITAAIHQHRQS